MVVVYSSFTCRCGNLGREYNGESAQFRQCNICGYHGKVWLEGGRWYSKWWYDSVNKDEGLYSMV